MEITKHPQDTICAISTPPGVGGIAVIRVSGTEAMEVTNRIFTPKSRKSLLDFAPNTLIYGELHNQGATIDDVVVSKYVAPHSFTGEDVIEISCHGSIYIQQTILKLLIEHGVRMAEAGEFTQRAFTSGKFDLAQAEAVADLIASKSAAAHRIAISQMRGGFSNELRKLRDEMITFASLIELELDFSEEEVEFADREKLETLAQQIQSVITKLSNSFATGNAIKNGIPVAIVGKTNVGKSTLLNRLVGEEKAIVSDVHGTTRDTIEDIVIINGQQIRLIDTAGLRTTTDTVEKIGIERTMQKIEQSNIILLITDITTPSAEITPQIEELLVTQKSLILVHNKCDKLSAEEQGAKVKGIADIFDNKVVQIVASAKLGEGIADIESAIELAANISTNDNDIVVSNIRHYQSLQQATAAMQRVLDGLAYQLPTVLLTQDIREAMHHIGEITGDISTSDLLESIFSRFCIGK